MIFTQLTLRLFGASILGQGATHSFVTTLDLTANIIVIWALPSPQESGGGGAPLRNFLDSTGFAKIVDIEAGEPVLGRRGQRLLTPQL